MKVVILAAGQGKRLLPLTQDLPKSLLKIHDITILEHILDRLVHCGIKETIIVVGHHEGKVKKKIRDVYKGMNIQYISNPEYNNTNNIYSVWLIKEFVKDGFILINGDDMFNQKILQNLIESEHKDAVVVDDSITDLPEEAMKITIKDGKVHEVSKEIAKENIHGDAIGIYKFSKEGSTKFFNEIKALLDKGENNVFYLKAMTNMVKNHNMYVVSTNKMTWFEVDDHNDLKMAHNIMKKIKEEESSS